VKAILLEVNTPGGSIVGSREMFEALNESRKPKVSYFREVAASGGYYVAMGTGYIVSNPDALTGSIGVRMTASEMSGLFRKIGYNVTVVTSGEMKDMGDPSRPLTPAEVEVLQSIVDQAFSEFKSLVAESRGDRLDSAGFETVLDGRVITGLQARRIGLVDQVGNRRDALRKAAELAGMEYDGDAPPVCAISARQGILGSAFSGAARIVSAALAEALKVGTGASGVRLEY
jgi:protease-4